MSCFSHKHFLKVSNNIIEYYNADLWENVLISELAFYSFNCLVFMNLQNMQIYSC